MKTSEYALLITAHFVLGFLAGWSYSKWLTTPPAKPAFHATVTLRE